MGELTENVICSEIRNHIIQLEELRTVLSETLNVTQTGYFQIQEVSC
jgi:hypothetical protein